MAAGMAGFNRAVWHGYGVMRLHGIVVSPRPSVRGGSVRDEQPPVGTAVAAVSVRLIVPDVDDLAAGFANGVAAHQGRQLAKLGQVGIAEHSRLELAFGRSCGRGLF